MIAALLTGIAAAPWMRAALRYGAIVLAVLLFLLSLRRFGERAGRLAERHETMEKANNVQRRMLEAAAPHQRLAESGSAEKNPYGENIPCDLSLRSIAFAGFWVRQAAAYEAPSALGSKPIEQ